jgi:hypothetical protein
MTIELTAELEQMLDDVARRQGTTSESLVLMAVRNIISAAGQESPKAPARSLADRLAPHIGVLDSGELIPGGARLSERRKEYAEMLMRDHLQGRP